MIDMNELNENSSSAPPTGQPPPTVLVTGATGYIGGRLVPRLLAAGFRVRCVVRCARKLAARAWASDPGVTILECDVDDTPSVASAMRGCEAAYYLVHSMMSAGGRYRAQDQRLASSFAQAAASAGVPRIIYLGGLGETGDGLSEHLRSRREVEAALASTDVPVTVLRAAMIIGSGSASFEILRYLVERLPIMVTPRWVSTQCQPIAVRDVLHYLVACLRAPETIGRRLDIGGPDVLTYRELMDRMSDCLRLPRRRILPVPVLTPRLSSLWIHLVTPVSHRIARPLAEGLRNRVVCRNDDAARMMPLDRTTVEAAIRAALGSTSDARRETVWSDAGPVPGDPEWAGGRVFTDTRKLAVSAPASRAFEVVCRIGGDNGYFGADLLWRLRGMIDRLIGGPGLRRGRRHPTQLAFGDAVDFWRVTDFEPGHRLELRAEMRLPGEATLTFEVLPGQEQTCTLVQTARFKPRGLAGLAYWYAVAPLHGIVFRGMLRGAKRVAEETSGSPASIETASTRSRPRGEVPT